MSSPDRPGRPSPPPRSAPLPPPLAGSPPARRGAVVPKSSLPSSARPNPEVEARPPLRARPSPNPPPPPPARPAAQTGPGAAATSKARPSASTGTPPRGKPSTKATGGQPPAERQAWQGRARSGTLPLPMGPTEVGTSLTGGQTELVGVLERILFQNEDTQHVVGELRPEGGRGVVTILGRLPGVQCGETLRVQGHWKRHPEYGDQLAVESFAATLPASLHGIRKYLGSGLIRGIGPKYAERIVDRFGTDTLRVISEESGRLREVEGIGAARIKAIKIAWDEQRALRDVLVFLQTYGVSVGQCLRLVKHYGNQAGVLLRQDPYRIAREVDYIGFKTADKIALNLGLANDSLPRLDAGLLHCLRELEDEGHTGAAPEALVAAATTLLDAPAPYLEKRLAVMLEAGELKQPLPGGLVHRPPLARAEADIARAIRRLRTAPSALPPIKVEAAISWAQERAGFDFAPAQTEAVRAALSTKFSILTGGPGTGKTTILRALVDILKAKQVAVVLASPTGRAAQRLAEATGAYAQTIHRLLRFDPAAGGFQANADNPLKAAFVIVDETSMLDTRLAAALFAAIPAEAHVCLVGDVDQLPSVGPGQVLADLIASGTARVTRLSVIFRQKGNSGIVTTAHSILAGESHPPPPVKDVASLQMWKDFQFLYADGADLARERTVELVARWFPQQNIPAADVQVLAPMHRGPCGIGALNTALQAALNPQGAPLPTGGLRAGDKVLQTRNNYDKGIFNGDLGRVVEFDRDTGLLRVDFAGEVIDLERSEWGDLTLAYAVSIHKSQGSEFRNVVIPLVKGHFMMLRRNLLYTAITRGKGRVVLVGEPAAYAMAVQRLDDSVRQTGLRGQLEAAEA